MLAMTIVGCGKAKRSTPARADELYTGALFRAHVALALELVSREHRRAAAICVTPRGWLEWVRDSDIHRAGAATLGPDLNEEVAVRYAFALAGERLLARGGA